MNNFLLPAAGLVFLVLAILLRPLFRSQSDAQPSTAKKWTSGPRLIAILLGVLLPGLSVSWYLQQDDTPAAVATPGTGHPAMAGQVMGQAPALDQAAAQLAARLKQQPDDADGWLLLASTYLHLQQPDAARKAYAHAQSLGKEDAQLAEQLDGMDDLPPIRDVSDTPPHDTAAMIAKLQSRLQDKPDDAAGWAMLGRSYQNQGRFDKAADAFAQALSLTPDSADLLADRADALAASHDRKLTGEPETLIAKALAIAPDHPKALWLAGTAALQRNDAAAALQYWQRLRTQIPDSSADARALDAAIRQAQSRIEGGPLAQSRTEPARIEGTLDIAADLRKRFAPTDSVFVFARAVSGPRMPVAVIRARVGDLPLHFVLDDKLAMRPDMRLSTFSQVVVTAKVSPSGSAMDDTDSVAVSSASMPTRGAAPLALTFQSPTS